MSDKELVEESEKLLRAIKDVNDCVATIIRLGGRVSIDNIGINTIQGGERPLLRAEVTRKVI